MNAVQRKRLLNVAKALRESKAAKEFTMGNYCDPECGTPHCALGHYASRRDLQRLLKLTAFAYGVDDWSFDITTVDGGLTGYDAPVVLDHFGITEEEAGGLFNGDDGCGGAKTPKQAARFIERFVARKEREAASGQR